MTIIATRTTLAQAEAAAAMLNSFEDGSSTGIDADALRMPGAPRTMRAAFIVALPVTISDASRLALVRYLEFRAQAAVA